MTSLENQNCPTDDRLTALLEGDMPSSDSQEIDAHLAECANCQQRLDQLTALPVGLAKAAPHDALSEQGVAAMVERLRQTSLAMSPTVDNLHGFAGQVVAQLKHYEAEELIGFGGSGVLVRARDVRNDHQVAIKVWPPTAANSTAQAERAKRESQSLARLDHPYVVRVLETGTTPDGSSYLVMEYVAGKPLSSWVKQHGALPPRRAATIVRDVAEALAAAHQVGLVHRDVKPSNILLEDDRQHIKLVDFGLVLDQQSDSLLTKDGSFAGTPHYMSPEQIRDPHTVDFRSDVYSLGVVLYELLTGTRPFRGILRMVLRQAMEDVATAPRKLDDSIPRDLETICLKAMSKEPGQRYVSADALGKDLQRWLDDKPIVARRPSALARVVIWSRKNPAMASAIGSIALLLAVVAVGGSLLSWRLANARDLAERRGHQARMQSETLLETLRMMVFEVPDRIYGDDEEIYLEDSERAVLEASLAGLARLPKESQAKLEVVEAVAAARARLALICVNSEDHEMSREHADAAIKLVDNFAQDDSLSYRLTEARSNASWALAHHAWGEGDLERAESLLKQMVHTDKQLLKHSSEDEPESRCAELVFGHRELAELALERQRWEQAKQFLITARSYLERAGDDDCAESQQLGMEVLLAQVECAQGNHEVARNLAIKTWRTIERSEYEDLPGDVLDLTEQLSELLCEIATKQRRHDEARRWLTNGVKLLERLAKDEREFMLDVGADADELEPVEDTVSYLRERLEAFGTDAASDEPIERFSH